MPPKVIVHNLKKRYDAVEAARGVSFEIEDGEIFGLIGPNGAGKTTTVECVIGLREPDEGTIEVCGIDARRRPREVKEKIGASLQTTALQEKITPREALALFGTFYRRKAEPAALLERFALVEKADAPFDTLSGGQRQRLALALAFVNNPELVFLDEPTAGLDPQSRRELHGEIAKMKDHRSRPHRRHRDAARARRRVSRRAVRVPGDGADTRTRVAGADSWGRGTLVRGHERAVPIGERPRHRRRGHEAARGQRNRGRRAAREQVLARGCVSGAHN
jgi:ABC-type Na+ transport system ATPase subunit NatA